MTAAEHDAPEPRAGRGVRVAHILGVQDAGRLLRDLATYLPTQVIPAIAGFIALPILARKLAPTELGVLAIAQTLVTLGWTIVASWLANTLIREYPAFAQRDDIATFARTLRRAVAWCGAGLAAYALLLGLGAIVSSAIRDNYALVIAAAGGLALQNIAVSLFAAGLRPRGYAVIEVGARIGGIGLGLAFVFHGWGVRGYLGGLAIASVVIGSVGLLSAWPRSAEPATASRPDLGPWLRYGIPASSAAVAAWALQFIDRYLLAGLKDTAAVGVYTVGAVIGDKLVAVPMFAMITASMPLLVTAYEQQGRAEVQRRMRAYTRIGLLVGLPVIAFSAVAARDIILVLTNRGDYLAGVRVVPLVAVGSLVYALTTIGCAGLYVGKRTKDLLYAALVGLVVNVAVNLALIPPFGITGAALATPIANIAYFAAAYTRARRHATWRFPTPTFVRGCVAAGIGYVAARAALDVGHGFSSRIGLAAVCGLLAYAAVLFVLGERRAASS